MLSRLCAHLRCWDLRQLKSAAGSFEVMPPCALLHNYMDTDEERRGFVDSMAEVQVKQQEVIMRQGDKGNNFYLIKSGTCDVWMADSAGERRNVRSLTAGSWCGELSLLTGKPRSASIMATSPEVTLLMVNRRAFNAALGDKIVKKRAEWVPFLRLLPIFAELSEDYELGLLADACREVRYAAGATMHEVGTPGDNKFFVVREGTVVAVAGGPAESTKYGRQAYFGHVELLQNSKHQETRRAETAVWCATFRKEDFLKLVPLHAFVREAGQQQLALKAEGAPAGSKMRGRRFGEAAEATTGVLTGKVASGKKKTTEQVARIMGAVSRNVIFSRLNEMQLTMLQEAMMEHTIHPGQNVITQGEKGNHFFIVDSGELDAFVQGEDPDSHPVRVRGFRAGESFGELALMYNCPRTATIQAATPVVLWSLDRVSFRTIVLEANTKKAASYESFLEKVPLLAPLDKDQRNRMVDALEEVTYAQDDAIITEGEEGTHFYVIARGEVVITKAGQGELARRREGDYFGELSLKTGAPTMASVTAAAAGTTVVRMDRGAFQRLLGPLGELLAMRKYTASGAELQQQASDADAESTGSASAGVEMPNEHKYIKAQRPMTLSDFTVTKGTLGEGAFGTVRRCRVRSTGEVFALKQMQKADIVSMGQVEHIMQETQILDRIAHPFVTNKWAGFVTPSNLILIMEFCPGGDLFDQLYKHKRFSVPDTRIYVSQARAFRPLPSPPPPPLHRHTQPPLTARGRSPSAGDASSRVHAQYGHRTPRPQAREHPGRPGRRAQADRLWLREGHQVPLVDALWNTRVSRA